MSQETLSKFKYVKLPNGTITGESVLRQTEDALNALGSFTVITHDTAAESIKVSDLANSLAETALQQANTAVATAEVAKNDASTAVTTVTSYAQTIKAGAESALSAQGAATAAAEDARIAKEGAEAAQASANKALQEANEANESAQGAQHASETASNRASEAEASATQAMQKAEEANQSANDARASALESATQARILADQLSTTRMSIEVLTLESTPAVSSLVPSNNVRAGDIVLDANGHGFLVEKLTEDGANVIFAEDTDIKLNRSVSYGETQALTDEQKKQARDNLGFNFSRIRFDSETNGLIVE